MATLYAKNTHSWSARASSNWTLTANGTDYQTPVAGDTLEANGKTITIDANMANSGGYINTAAGGGFTVSANGIIVVTNIGLAPASTPTGTTTILTCSVASPSTVTITAGSIVGGSAASTRGVSVTGTGTTNITVVDLKSGSANSSAAVQLTSAGIVNITASGSITALGSTNEGVIYIGVAATGTLTVTAISCVPSAASSTFCIQHNAASATLNATITNEIVGGSISGSTAVYNGSSGTLNLTGSVKGGAGSNSYGAQNAGAGTFTISGSATGGDLTHGAYNSSTGTLSVGTAVGNGYGVGATAGKSAGIVGAFNLANGVLKVKKMVFGALGASPTYGCVSLISDITNSVLCYKDGGGTKELIDVANAAGVLPATTDVRYGTAYNGGSNTGTAYIPAASSVAYGVNVDATTGTAVLTAQGLVNAIQSTVPTGKTVAIGARLPDVAIGASGGLPLAADTSGRVTLAAISHTGAIIPTVSAVTGLTAANLDVAVSSRNATAPPTAAAVASQVRTELAPELGRISTCATVDTTLAAMVAYQP